MRQGGHTAWSPGSLLLVLAVLLAPPAPAGALQTGAAAGGPPAARKQPPLPRGKRSGLDARVARLTRALGLDAAQQAALRRVLQEQRLEVQRIWNEGSIPPADRVAATRAVSSHTADRIRGLLNEDQRKRYDPPPRGDPGQAVGGANVEEWMSKQRKL